MRGALSSVESCLLAQAGTKSEYMSDTFDAK